MRLREKSSIISLATALLSKSPRYITLDVFSLSVRNKARVRGRTSIRKHNGKELTTLKWRIINKRSRQIFLPSGFLRSIILLEISNNPFTLFTFLYIIDYNLIFFRSPQEQIITPIKKFQKSLSKEIIYQSNRILYFNQDTKVSEILLYLVNILSIALYPFSIGFAWEVRKDSNFSASVHLHLGETG